MDSGAESSQPTRPVKTSDKHVETAGIAFATFIHDQRRTGGPEDAEAILQSLGQDNKAVANFVRSMTEKTNDLEAKRLIATTAWVVFGAASLALDPECEVEKPEP